MTDLDFWLRQPEMKALVAAFLLAGHAVPEQLSHSVSTTNYPPKVAAMIELIRNTIGAVHRNHIPIGRKSASTFRTTISQQQFRSLLTVP